MSSSSSLPIVDAIIFRRPDGTSKCCGAVTYENKNHVIEAIRTLHGSSLNDRAILVKRDEAESQRGYYNSAPARTEVDSKTTVFVTNIGFDINVDQLRSYLEKAGEINSITLFEGVNGMHRGRAIVQYNDKDSAANAILKLDGVTFENRVLYIRFCNPL